MPWPSRAAGLGCRSTPAQPSTATTAPSQSRPVSSSWAESPVSCRAQPIVTTTPSTSSTAGGPAPATRAAPSRAATSRAAPRPAGRHLESCRDRQSFVQEEGCQARGDQCRQAQQCGQKGSSGGVEAALGVRGAGQSGQQQRRQQQAPISGRGHRGTLDRAIDHVRHGHLPVCMGALSTAIDRCRGASRSKHR